MHPPDSAADREREPRNGGDFPDDIARAEGAPAVTTYDAHTPGRLSRVLLYVALALVTAFIAVRIVRFVHDRRVASDTARSSSIAPLVDVVVASPGDTTGRLELPGQTAAWFETTLYARVNGYVARWLVDIGDRVHAGQVMAVIETPELDAESAAAEAQLKASRAQVKARQAEVEFARTTNERWRDSPRGVVSEQERESKKADYDTATARLFAAEAQVALDQARVRQYESLARFKQVVAPFDGTVTERKIDIGNLVTAGSGTTTTPLYRVSQTSRLRVYTDVPQALAAELAQPGLKARIRVNDDPSVHAEGVIARTSGAVSSQARTLRAEVDLDNARGGLLSGMYVSVEFDLPHRNLIEVPAAAIVFRSGGPEVARVAGDGRVTFAPVTIARDNGSVVGLAAGVSAGDRLIVNVSNQITDGSIVEVHGDGPATGAGGPR